MKKHLNASYALYLSLYWVSACFIYGYTRLFLNELGFSADQVGLLLAFDCAGAMVLQPLLARIIDSSAGSDWLTDEFRMCVGEVVLNRVASPEFPDTIQGVVYQKGQYSVVNTARFASLAPRFECVDAALRLLQGERHMVPGVVYQADYLQGELFSVYFDRRLGNTYFCLSENLDLYP